MRACQPSKSGLDAPDRGARIWKRSLLRPGTKLLSMTAKKMGAQAHEDPCQATDDRAACPNPGRPAGFNLFEPILVQDAVQLLMFLTIGCGLLRYFSGPVASQAVADGIWPMPSSPDRSAGGA